MFTSETVSAGGGEHTIMAKAAKMELLRALVSECLFAAAEEIVKVVERTMLEYEEEMSCSEWVVNSHGRLLDAANCHNEDSVQTCVPDVKPLPPASVDYSVHWEEAANSNAHVESAAPSEHGGDDVPGKSETDMKPFKCPICPRVFSSNKTMVRHIKRHPDDESLLYNSSSDERCQRQKHTEDQSFLKTTDPRREAHVTACRRMEEEQKKVVPLTVTLHERSEFEHKSLQPLCLDHIQTVADIDKDSGAALPVRHINTGAGECVTDDRSVTAGDLDPAHGRKTMLPRRASGTPTEPAVVFEGGTAQKPYKCRWCGKCFSLMKTLIRHVKIHAEDTSYQCQFCGRNFCQKSDLVNHTRIHTGERPYRCQECPKSFAQKGNLVVHMRKHWTVTT